jgi:hypothetical protein
MRGVASNSATVSKPQDGRKYGRVQSKHSYCQSTAQDFLLVIQRGNMGNPGERPTLKYMVTKLRKNSQEYGYHIQLAGSFKLRDMPSLLGSHIPSRAELEAFLKSRRLVDHTAEMILQDLDALPPGREFYLLVYDS